MKQASALVLGGVLSFLAARNTAAQAGLQDVIAKSYAAEANRDYAGAMKLLQSVAPSDNENYIYHLRLGWLAYMSGKWNESIAEYETAVNLAPGAVEPLIGMLNPLAAAVKTSDLLKTHERILGIDPHNYKSLQQAAWLRYQAKDYKKAVGYYARILKLYPTDVEMMLGLGYSLKLSGNKDAANGTFNQVLLLSPKNPRALAGLG